MGLWQRMLGMPPNAAASTGRRRLAEHAMGIGLAVESIDWRGEHQQGNVYAVVYRPAMPSRPLPYKLFLVSEESCEEIPILGNEKYALRGRK
jgi:hypothetical protein